MSFVDQFLISLSIKWDAVPNKNAYPFSIPAISKTKHLDFSPHATFFVGENGSGKSTLLEAIALRLGLNPEGGSRNLNFSTRETHSNLNDYLKVERGVFRRPQDTFFLRAESLYNVASKLDELGIVRGYGDRSWIYNFSEEGITRIEYEQTEHYQVTKAFLDRRQAMMREIFGESAE